MDNNNLTLTVILTLSSLFSDAALTGTPHVVAGAEMAVSSRCSHLINAVERSLRRHSNGESGERAKELRTKPRLVAQLEDGRVRKISIPFDDANRAIATWVLKSGGSVTVKGESPKRLTISGTEELPESLFQVVAIAFRMRGDSMVNERVSDDALARFAELKHLEILELYDTRVSGTGLGRLSEVKGLHTLCLSGADLTDDSLAGITRLRSLINLTLGGRRLTGGCLKHVKELTELRTAALFFDVGGADLAELAQLKKLEKLSLQWWHDPAAAMPNLASIKSLKSLDFVVDGDLADPDLQFLSSIDSMSQLKTLSIPSLEQISSDGVKRLRVMRGLESLTINAWECDGAAFESIAVLPALTSLSITSRDWTDENCRHLAQLEKLQSLEIASEQVTGSGLGYFDNLKSLKSLTLQNREKALTTAACGSLRKLRRLERLRLEESDDRGARSDVELFETVAALPQLTDFHYDGCKITSDQLDRLARAHNLKRLLIHDLDRHRHVLVRLKPLASLRSLSLVGNDVEYRDLLKLDQLEELTIIGLGTDVEHLGKLGELPNLKRLTVSSDLTRNQPLQTLAEQLKMLSNVKYLKIFGFDFSTPVLLELKTALPQCEIWRQPWQQIGDQDDQL